MVRADRIRYLCDTDHKLEIIYCDQSSISYPLHNHTSVFTIGIVFEGSVTLKTNHDEQIYENSQIFMIPPYVPHSIRGNDAYSLLSLCIHKNIISCSDYAIDKIKLCITNLLAGALASDKINEELILHSLSCLRSFHPFLSITDSAHDKFMHQLKRQLELFPERKFSIEEMAQEALTSKYYFIRRFKQIAGLTPHQFQIQNRIRKAQRLICETNTITEAALATGFCDQSHFIRQFEKMVGLTPSAYKQSVRNFQSDAGHQQSAGINFAKRQSPSEPAVTS